MKYPYYSEVDGDEAEAMFHVSHPCGFQYASYDWQKAGRVIQAHLDKCDPEWRARMHVGPWHLLSTMSDDLGAVTVCCQRRRGLIPWVDNYTADRDAVTCPSYRTFQEEAK